ncbi:MAG: metallophosphoesterase family protein [Nitrospirae bacterium]|nr:metallophosphoesterase family protein [Nitrospirota bacterium]
MGRRVIVGDVHGCYREWKALLRELRIRPDDEVISVGDLICKGPDSRGVLESAMEMPNFRGVVGNHELRFLGYRRNGAERFIKPYDEAAMEQLRDGFEEFMLFLEGWPGYLDYGAEVVVHAGLRPGRSLEEQTLEDLTSLKVLEETGQPWYEQYRGEATVIFGHWPRPEPMLEEKLVAIDTGCVLGGRLTAFVLPDRRLVSVPAAKVYHQRTRPWGKALA